MEGMMHYKDACDIYGKALHLDPNNKELEEGMKRAKERLSEFCGCILL